MRILVPLHEAFGGRGGIAKFNRDLIAALCAHPDVREVVAVPRIVTDAPGPMPEKLRYLTGGLAGKASWFARVGLAAVMRPRFDLIVCGHINLLPAASAARMFQGAPLGLVIHGIEAWQPTGRALTDRLANGIDFLISVSAHTRARFASWARVDAARTFILPNMIDMDHFTPGPANPALARRWGIEGRRAVLTLARLEASERYKGIDEILDVLPALVAEFPDLVYVVAGDGSDRARLEAKARDLGVAGHVVFTGYVAESEKRDLYRLAHVFAMPGRGEGFGIVFLEAMACGIPVVASKLDGSREAVRDGALGILVDPADPTDVRAGLVAALARPRGAVPPGLAYFGMPGFRERIHAIVAQVGRVGVRPLATRRVEP